MPDLQVAGSPLTPLRVGMIGCGLVMELKHMRVLQGVPSIQVIAACDPDRRRLDEVALRFGIPRRYADSAELLADPDVEAVGVCTPPALHEEAVVAAIAAGKHVLVEKPPALDVAACERMIARAEASSVKVQVGFHMRFHRHVRAARARLQRGDLGVIEALRGVWMAPTRLNRELPVWRNEVGTGGGCLMEFGVHQYDLWRHLLGCEVGAVSAVVRDERWPAQSASLCAVMSNGATVSQVMSEVTAHDIHYEIYGRRGCLRLDCLRYDGLEPRRREQFPGGLAMVARRAWKSLRDLPAARESVRVGGDFFLSYRAQWLGLATAIRQGTEVECSLRDGLAAVRVALAARAAADSGRTVAVAAAPSSPALGN